MAAAVTAAGARVEGGLRLEGPVGSAGRRAGGPGGRPAVAQVRERKTSTSSARPSKLCSPHHDPR